MIRWLRNALSYIVLIILFPLILLLFIFSYRKHEQYSEEWYKNHYE